MSTPTITLTPELKSYLERKDMPYLVVELAECKTCGGAIAEVYARIPRKAEPARLLEQGCRTLEGDGVTLLLTSRFIRFDDEIQLGLRSFIGVKDVSVKGLHL